MQSWKVLKFFPVITLVFLGLFMFVGSASASSSGPNSAQTFTSDAATGTIAWTNPSFAISSNNSYATFGGSGQSRYLKVISFGFAIPVGSVINGVEVAVEKKADLGATYTDKGVFLVKAGTVSGNNNATTTVWGTSDAVVTYGGATDLWGLTLTPADVNAGSFGVAFTANCAGGQCNLGPTNGSVDYISMTVYYTPYPTVTAISPSSGDQGATVTGVSVTGTNFQSGAVVTLTQGGTTITGTGFSFASSTSLTGGSFKLSGSTGNWDVTVTNPDTGVGTLTSGFTINHVSVPVFLANSAHFVLDPVFQSISGFTSSTTFKSTGAGGQNATGYSSSTTFNACAGILCYAYVTSSPNPALIPFVSGYRWYDTADATTTGSALAAANTSATGPAQGTGFRLRTLLHAPVDFLAGPTVLSSATTANDATYGGARTWSSPTSALASDDVYASVVFPDASLPSHYLHPTNFGFALPASSTITGVAVQVERKDDGAKVKDFNVRLVLADDSFSPNGNATTTIWSGTDTVITYGGPTDMWGFTTSTLTAADVDKDGFGFGFSVGGDPTACAGGCTAYVDAIQMIVYYQPDNLKLQYATKSGTCDTAFSGESYADVSASAGAIRFYDSTTPADGDAIIASSSDPTHGGDTVLAESYEESNNFGATSTVSSGNDGLWDFSLVDFSSAPSSTYCFRVVSSDGAVATPEAVPEIIVPGSTGVTVSGTVYADQGITTTTSTVALSINGGTKMTTSTDSGGAFTFTGVTQPNAGDVITVWMDNAGGGNGLGATVTLYPTSGNLTGIDIYKQRLIVRHENSGPIANTDIDACTKTLGAGCADSDLHFDVSGGNITVDNDWALYIWGGKTYTPGGNITLSPGALSTSPGGDLVWASSTSVLSAAGATISVGGDWNDTAAGTATLTGTSLTFTATNTGMVIDSGGQTFAGPVDFNGSGGGWSAANNTMTVSGALTMTAGTLDSSAGSANIVVNDKSVSGGAGVINLTAGTFTMRTNSPFGSQFGSPGADWNFNNLVIGNQIAISSTINSLFAATGTLTVAGVFTIASSTDTASTTFHSNVNTYVLSGTTGDPFVITSGLGDFVADTSTYSFTGNNAGGNTNVNALTYYNLAFNNSAETYTAAGTIATTNTATLTAGTLDMGANTLNVSSSMTTAYGSTWQGSGNINVAGDVTMNGTVNYTAGTFTHMVSTSRAFTVSTSSIALGALIFDDTSGGSATITASGTAAINATDLSLSSTGGGTLTLTTTAPFTLTGSVTIAASTVLTASSTTAFSIGQNFTNNGTFNAASSTFTFTGSPGITGTSTFWNFTGGGSAPRTIRFRQGQTFTFGGLFKAAGSSTSTVTIRSQLATKQWYIKNLGTEDVGAAVIFDSGCDGASTNVSVNTGFGTLDQGNNGTCWLFQSLGFAVSTTTVGLANLNSINTWTATSSNTLTVTSTVESGYNVFAYAVSPLRIGLSGATISDWTGTNAAPTSWTGDCTNNTQCGFGYSTDDADLTQFSSTKFAGFSSSSPGDVVAKKTSSATSDVTTVTYKVSVPSSQSAGDYQSSIAYILTQQF